MKALYFQKDPSETFIISNNPSAAAVGKESLVVYH